MSNKLPILAIETSGVNCSVALMIDTDVFYEYSIYKKNVHSEKLLQMVDELLRTARIKLNQVGHIAVSEGPGSFTGLRIGFSAAKGLAFGAQLPIAAVPTYDALSFHLCGFLKEGDTFSIANKVNTSELYFARYKKEGNSYATLKKLSIIDKKDIDNLIADADLLFGDFESFDFEHTAALPTGQIISKWSYFFGEDLLTFNFDYKEPNYLKKFTPKQPKVKK